MARVLDQTGDGVEQRVVRALTIPRASYFVTTGDVPRVRRPRDVAAAGIGMILIA
jgi:hypothetical protein